MNPLVKKEIRLLLPSWSAAMLLAMVQAISRPFDFYIASLLFFGLVIMALTPFGREASLNTFSSLLAQPMERLRIWQMKLSVLAVAFVTVFLAWLVAFSIAIITSSGDASDAVSFYNLFITVCLIATATFTGGLWTTLLLRQLAGAFWLTLLVPAVLSGASGVLLVEFECKSLVIAVLSVVFAVYSVAGFLFARWLFFRAQDVGWSGGVISLPEWKIFARSENAISTRHRKPVFALLKKEFQLQQISLFGATGILVLHLSTIFLRKYHHFAADSSGEALTAIVWILWLVLAPVIGSMAVAEERRLGVMEGQLCLPVSRRLQFTTKGMVAFGLGIFLGGVMPVLLEYLATSFGAQNPMFSKPADNSETDFFWWSFWVVMAESWLTLLGFYASTLSRSFLQSVGFGIAAFFISFALLVTNGDNLFHGFMATKSFLPLIIAVPTIIGTLLWLAYLNFKNFRPGWPLWRRNLLGFATAFAFVIVMSLALYNRFWEIFEPAEPAHGAAKLSLANPPTVQIARYNNLLVRLPDGRVWFDGLSLDYAYDGSVRWKYLWRTLTHPLPESLGPQQFLAGSNWVAATTEHLYFGWKVDGKHFWASDFMETVGIQPDGTLWISDKPATNRWTPGKLQQFGSETNWRQLAQGSRSVVLLKGDGTLWHWGFSTTNEFHQWPGLRTVTPYQIGTNADWQELFSLGGIFARQADGRVWELDMDWKTAQIKLDRATNYDEIVSQTASHAGDEKAAFVRADGTLWVVNRDWDAKSRLTLGTGVLQVGKENGWRSVAVNFGSMVALKTDGSLWQWNFKDEVIVCAIKNPPTRLGIHNDWVAVAGAWNSVIALSADGSLWLWPDKKAYEYEWLLIRLPKQPQPLGNIFGKTE